MNRETREAIARIEIVDAAGQVISRGTGTLVGPGLVLTALHVVADRRADPPQPLPGRIRLVFPTGQRDAEIHGTLMDARADWVLLRCEELPNVPPVPLGRLTQAGVDWETYGFPDANPRDGMIQTGRVEAWDGELEGQAALQLFSMEAAAGNGAPVKGLSGAPVFVNEFLVGHMRFALMQDGRTVAGTLYACPVSTPETASAGLLAVANVPFRRSTTTAVVEEMRETERGTRRIVLAGLLVLALLIGGAVFYFSRPPRPPSPAIRTIAVLPLRNMTVDSGRSAALAGGIRAMVTTELRRISSLRVIDLDNLNIGTRGTGATQGPDLVAAGVTAEAALQSEVLLEGGEVSIRLALLQTVGRTNAWSQVWSDTYKVHGNTAFQIQQDVAREVVAELSARLTSRDSLMLATAHTSDSVAAEFFILGKDLLRRAYFDADAARRAAVMFSRAVDRDPGFALAYAWLSEAHSLLHFLGADQRESRGEQALAAADTALALNPDLPEGHLALGAYYYRVLNLPDQALRELRTASRALPNSASALLLTGLVYRRQDSWAEAACALQAASDLEPGNWGPAYYAGETLLFIRDYAQAARYLERAIADSIDASGMDQRARAFVARALLLVAANGDTLQAREAVGQMFTWFSKPAVLAALSHDEYRPLLGLVDSPVLDSLFETTPITGDGDTTDYFLTRAILARRGSQPLISRGFYEVALARVNQEITQNPLAVQAFSDRAAALMGLGRHAEARASAARAMDLLNHGGLVMGSRTAAGVAVEWVHLQTLIQAGDRRAAIANLRHSLEDPGILSPDWIQADPSFAPVVSAPGYKELKHTFFQRISYPVLRHGPDPRAAACPAP